jgi:hypothetical protein
LNFVIYICFSFLGVLLQFDPRECILDRTIPSTRLGRYSQHLAGFATTCNSKLIGTTAIMISEGIAGKEKSENKVCKLIRFVRQTSWQEIVEH